MFGDRLFQQQGHLVDLIGQIGNQLDLARASSPAVSQSMLREQTMAMRGRSFGVLALAAQISS